MLNIFAKNKRFLLWK